MANKLATATKSNTRVQVTERDFHVSKIQRVGSRNHMIKWASQKFTRITKVRTKRDTSVNSNRTIQHKIKWLSMKKAINKWLIMSFTTQLRRAVSKVWRWLRIALCWSIMIHKICHTWLRTSGPKFKRCRGKCGISKKASSTLMIQKWRVKLSCLIRVRIISTASIYFWTSSSTRSEWNTKTWVRKRSTRVCGKLGSTICLPRNDSSSPNRLQPASMPLWKITKMRASPNSTSSRARSNKYNFHSANRRLKFQRALWK